MRTLTSYAYTLDAATNEEAVWRFNLYRGMMNAWLEDQGVNDPKADSSDTFIELKRRDLSHEGATVDSFRLTQHLVTSSQDLITQFDLAVKERSLALFMHIQLDEITYRIGPANVHFECPSALHSILDSGDWQLGSVRVHPNCRRVLSDASTQRLIQHITAPNRTLPIVLVRNAGSRAYQSNHLSHMDESENPYTPIEWRGFVLRLQNQIAALAEIYEVNDTIPLTEWQRTDTMGGAVASVIWPLDDRSYTESEHPHWAPRNYFVKHHPSDQGFAMDELQYGYYEGWDLDNPPWIRVFERTDLMGAANMISETILEQAAFQPVPKLIDDIRRQFAAAERERLTSNGNFEAWEKFFQDELEEKDQRISSQEESLKRRDKEFDGLQTELDLKQGTIDQLKFQLNQQSASAENDDQARDATVSPEPATVADAIEIAGDQCKALSFGPRATDKLDSLNPNAGPPRRILNDLKALNQCSKLLQDGVSLGQDVIAWLKDQNINASKESSSRMNQHAAALTFLTARDTYEQMGDHIKYRGTGLDREARIHFNVHESNPEDEVATIDIGYVGPKIMPD